VVIKSVEVTLILINGHIFFTKLHTHTHTHKPSAGVSLCRLAGSLNRTKDQTAHVSKFHLHLSTLSKASGGTDWFSNCSHIHMYTLTYHISIRL